MAKKSLTTKEIFCGMPHLQKYFTNLDRMIEKFDPQVGESVGVKELKKKRSALLKTVKEMDISDIQLIYYAHRVGMFYPHSILNALKKLFATQEELKKLISGEMKPTELDED